MSSLVSRITELQFGNTKAAMSLPFIFNTIHQVFWLCTSIIVSTAGRKCADIHW